MHFVLISVSLLLACLTSSHAARKNGHGLCGVTLDRQSEVGLVVQITKKGMDNILAAGIRGAELEYSNWVIPKQKFPANGYKVELMDIRVHDLTPPQVHTTLIPPSSGSVDVQGGYYYVCGKWAATKDGKRTEGDICAMSENGKGLDVQAVVSIQQDQGRIKVETDACKFDIPLDIQMTGGDDQMRNDFHGFMRDILQKMAGDQACDMINQKIKELLQESLIKVNAQWGVKYAFQSFAISESNMRFSLGANVTFYQA